MKIVKFGIKRLLSGILTLFLLVSIVFFMIRLLPGSPFQANAISQSTLAALENQHGLNESLFVQYRIFLSNLLQGDFGVSFKNPEMPVSTIIFQAVPNTMKLGLSSLIIAFVFGVLIALIQANTRNRLLEKSLSVFTSLSMSIPNFAIALFLVIIFGVQLHWAPIVGTMSPKNWILPVIALALYPMAMIAKMTYTSYNQAMQQECLLMAKAKGLKKSVIIWRYGLKQAMIPVVSMMGPTVSFLLTGSFVVESIFSISGLGMEFVQSIHDRDYTLILGLVIFMGFIVIVVHAITDIICALLDRRMAVLNP